MLNPMCKNCIYLGASCKGTQETVWTGCIYRKTKEAEPVRREDSPRWCIFEKRICRYANKNGNVFTCEAPSDNDMTCR